MSPGPSHASICGRSQPNASYGGALQSLTRRCESRWSPTHTRQNSCARSHSVLSRGVVHTMCVRACFRVCACVRARALCVLCAYVLRRMRPFGYIGLEHSQESQRHPQQQC